MLLSVSAILQQTVTAYRRHTRYFILYMVWIFLITFTLQFIEKVLLASGVISSEGLAFLIFLISSIIISIIGLWLNLGLFVAAKRALANEPMSPFITTMREVAPYLPAALIVVVLYILYLIVGTAAFVVPGLILAVWYIFSFFNVLFLGQPSMAAMATSKNLVVGRWIPVAWRLIAPSGIIVGIAVLVQVILLTIFSGRLALLETTSALAIVLNSFVVTLLYTLIFPLVIIALLVVYLDLRAHPVEMAVATPPVAPAAQ